MINSDEHDYEELEDLPSTEEIEEVTHTITHVADWNFE